jgi:hypothetical protein
MLRSFRVRFLDRDAARKAGLVVSARRSRRGAPSLVLMTTAVALGAIACESVPLGAPTESTISVTASTGILPPGGTAEITALVIEQSGTAVHNGTVVRFTATNGQVSPVEVETRDGLAVTTFTAANTSGVARIRATSGSATGGDASAPSNVVEIQIGGAAATTVTLGASSSRVPPGGGTVTLVASVTDAAGNGLAGVTVTFTTTEGTLSATSAATDSEGQARVQLTTTRDASVTARVADKTSPAVAIAVAAETTVGLSYTPANPVAGQAVSLTVTPTIPAGGQAPRVVVSWGDGSQTDLLTVPSARTVAHVYTSADTYSVVVTSTADGIVSTVSTTIPVAARPPIGVNVGASSTSPQRCQSVEFTATASPASEAISTYDWTINSNTNSEDETVRTTGNRLSRLFRTTGTKTVAVTARTPDGREGVGQTQVSVIPETTVVCPP